MSIEVVKDCADLWARLFDHRPFLNGEIKLFLKEFGESRKLKEDIYLEENLKSVTSLKERQIPNALENLEKLQKLNTLIDISVQHCNTILENELQYNDVESLKSKEEKRAEEWNTFMGEINSEYLKIQTTFAAKKQELYKFYEDLAEKLYLN